MAVVGYYPGVGERGWELHKVREAPTRPNRREGGVLGTDAGEPENMSVAAHGVCFRCSSFVHDLAGGGHHQ